MSLNLTRHCTTQTEHIKRCQTMHDCCYIKYLGRSPDSFQRLTMPVHPLCMSLLDYCNGCVLLLSHSGFHFLVMFDSHIHGPALDCNGWANALTTLSDEIRYACAMDHFACSKGHHAIMTWCKAQAYLWQHKDISHWWRAASCDSSCSSQVWLLWERQ